MLVSNAIFILGEHSYCYGRIERLPCLGTLLTIPSSSLSTLDSSSLDNAYMQSIASRLAAIFLCAMRVRGQVPYGQGTGT